MTTQSLLPLIGVFNAEEVQATPMTSREDSENHKWSPEKKQGGWVSTSELYFFFNNLGVLVLVFWSSIQVFGPDLLE